MRVVLDTNVFVSAVFFGGVPGVILEAWRDGRFRLALSEAILEEYVAILHRLNRKYPVVDVEAIVELLLSGSDVVETGNPPVKVCSDPKDDMFLACAVEAGATAIVSGDKHLLAVDGYRGVRVLTPAVFVGEFIK